MTMKGSYHHHRTMAVFWLLIVVALSCSTRMVQAQPRSKNFQCINATIIPSQSNIFAVTPYVTSVFQSRSIDPNPPNNSCTGLTYYGARRSVWYQWTPPTSGYYDLKSTIYNQFGVAVQDIPWYLSIMTGTSCSNLQPVGCRRTGSRGVYLNTTLTYFITIRTNQIDLNVSLTLSPTSTLRPINDDCQNAIEIPSSAKLPYNITTPSLITNATIQPNERLPSCDRLVEYGSNKNGGLVAALDEGFKNTLGGHSIWYTYTPPTTGYYNFTTLGTRYLSFNYESEAQITIGVYEATSSSGCSDMANQFTEVYCSRFHRIAIDRSDELKAGKKYYIQIVPDMYLRPLSTQVSLTINRAPEKVSNDKCIEAIPIDPIVGLSNVSVDLSGATTEALEFPNGCGQANLFLPGVWYKYVHAGGVTEILHQVCRSVNTRGITHSIFIGDDCNNLQCTLAGSGFRGGSCDFNLSFYTRDEPTTYWFLFYAFVMEGDAPAKFSVGFNRRNNFRMINAVSDTVLGIFTNNTVYSYGSYGTIGYSPETATTTKLSIDAVFDPTLNVQSTRMIYTNPNMTRCENVKPFSVFGDRDGNYRAGLITLGTHEITAIPYSEPKCQGASIPGATISNRLSMLGCIVGHDFIDENNTLTALPCSTYLTGGIICHFVARNVTIDLFNADTNTSIDGYLDLQVEGSATYYTFGNKSDFYPINLLPSSKYVLTMTIERVQHVTTFAATKTCIP